MLAAAASAAPARAADLLPDLDQEQPTALEVVQDSSGSFPRFHLGFDSAVDNRGAGPLTINAHRDDTSRQQMVGDQAIATDDGGTRTVPDVARLQYTVSEDHDHWHLLGFDHYELRRASDYKLVAPDQKTGFCLGDRFNTHPDETLPGESDSPYYSSQCGRRKTDLLELTEGISVGYGDVYYAILEGQFVDLTGVPAGQYYLVHRANSDGKLVESDYTNNAASLLIELSWPDGTDKLPSVKQLRGCKADDWCPGPRQQPPALPRKAAEKRARTALTQALGFSPQGFKIACAKALTRESRACTGNGKKGKTAYRTRITVGYERTREGELFLTYRVTGKRGARKLKPRSGRVRIGRAKAASESAVAEPGERLVALDDPLLDGVALGPVVHEVPRLVRHPLGGLGQSLPAQ